MKTGKLPYPTLCQKPLCFLLTWGADTTILKFLRVIKPTLVSLGSMVALISQSFTFLQSCHLVYRPRLLFSPKLFKAFGKTLETSGICIAIFLDDGWAIERDHQVCSSVAKAVKTDLGQAGFITNDEKTIWEPCQQIDWLGLIWDSARGTVEIVHRKHLQNHD